MTTDVEMFLISNIIELVEMNIHIPTRLKQCETSVDQPWLLPAVLRMVSMPRSQHSVANLETLKATCDWMTKYES